MNWIPATGKKKRGRPRKTWRDTICKDLALMDVSWDEATQLAVDQMKWRGCIARCANSTRKD